jgi:hypothetical protein
MLRHTCGQKQQGTIRMDTLRGPLGSLTGTDYAEPDYGGAEGYDAAEDEIGHDTLPPAIGQDDRRMQVRAYNHWASLLGDRHFPLIADLETGSLPDFDTHSVLIDVTGGIEDPVVRYVGQALAEESGCDPQTIRSLSDVPGRSLLSRITDHYLQIIANRGADRVRGGIRQPARPHDPVSRHPAAVLGQPSQHLGRPDLWRDQLEGTGRPADRRRIAAGDRPGPAHRAGRRGQLGARRADPCRLGGRPG